jgi:ElaB/YqjD/DUF883 family membrane-anchored ribosome-binding protein
MTMTDVTDAMRGRLAHDVRTVIADLEDLMRLTAADAGEEAVAIRERVRENLRQLKARVQAAEVEATRQVREAFETTDRQVRSHPWQTAGVAAVAGLLVGLLLRHR